jgi:protein MpaA
MNSAVERLRKNINGYFGEKIDIAAVLGECVALGEKHGWRLERLKAFPKPDLIALVRAPSKAAAGTSRIYISAGIHGDEPAGPLAVRQLLEDNRWPAHAALWVLPCLNPTGSALNRRENAEGTDLNRQYLQPKAEETLAHIAWLNAQPEFDLCLCLHEDWESDGFYLYELNPENRPSLAPAILKEVAQVCPIDHSEIIEGRPAQGGLIRPSADLRSRPQWPEAFFLLMHKTRLSYTLEAPSDFALKTRVESLVAAVQSAAIALQPQQLVRPGELDARPERNRA